MENRDFSVVGVPEGGIIVADIKDEVPESLICKYFGQKSSKSGWKYDVKTTLEEQEAIYSLYRRVYESKFIPNKELTLQFARGLILMSLGKKVDWNQFRDERRKYRQALQKRREIARGGGNGREGDRVVQPSTIGRKRHSAPALEDGLDFPSKLNLSVKVESGDVLEGPGIGKRVLAKGRVSVLYPSWVPDDVQMMEGVIVEKTELVNNWEDSLAESVLVSESFENRLRRAKILKSDREAMIVDSELEIEKIGRDELAVQAQIEEKAFVSVEIAKAKLSKEELLCDKTKLESLEFQKLDSQRTCRRSREVVKECDLSIVSLEIELESRHAREKDLSLKIGRLKGLVGSMAQQLRLMEEGSGVSFFPRPVIGSPMFPVTMTHTLNACPMCCLWYSCWDYITASCGHCYHSWCLAEHAKNSDKCLISSCEKKFLAHSKIAIGIRPVVATTSLPIAKKVEGHAMKDLAITGQVGKKTAVELKKVDSPSAIDISVGEDDSLSVGGERTVLTTTVQPAKSIVSEWNVDAPEKDVHQSQFSQTNFIVSSGSASETEDRLRDELCFSCNLKPPAVRLLSCGHAFFCFGCISGKDKCPFCFKKISGWEPVQVSGGAPTAMLSASLLQSSNKKKKISKPKDTTIVETPSSAIEASALLEDDNDDIGDGLVHWCDDTIFKAGGERTIQFVSEAVDTKHIAVGHENKLEDEQDSDHEGSAEPQQEVKCSAWYKRQKTTAFSNHKGFDTLNHTRVVDKAMSEILGVLPVPNIVEKKSQTLSVSTPSSAITRGRRRPVGGLKGASQSVAQQRSGTRNLVVRQKTLPARLKDL